MPCSDVTDDLARNRINLQINVKPRVEIPKPHFLPTPILACPNHALAEVSLSLAETPQNGVRGVQKGVLT